MRTGRAGLTLISAVLLGLAGCASSDPFVKPPAPPEEYRAPPSDDARFSQPVKYCKEAMEQEQKPRPAMGAGMGGPGMGGGMGGMGGMGGPGGAGMPGGGYGGYGGTTRR